MAEKTGGEKAKTEKGEKEKQDSEAGLL
jgi:hypothetical protein